MMIIISRDVQCFLVAEDMKNGMEQIWKYLAGQPYANFKALGTVRDEDGNPIKGIQVTVRQHWSYAEPADNKLFTDAEGTYQLIRDVFDELESVTVTFETRADVQLKKK